MRKLYYLWASIYFAILGFLVRQATRNMAVKHSPSQFGLLLRTYLKRPEWLYYPGVGLDPIKRFTFRSFSDSTPEDRRLCERLIASYKLATRDESSKELVSGLWEGNIQKHYTSLTETLCAGDPAALATTLASMFQQPFLYGIASSDLGKDSGYAVFIRMKILEELLSLAESLGVVRTETPEQGVLGHAFADGLEELVKKIEKQLDISLNFPDVGGAYGLEIGGRLITPESSEHIYVASRISEAIARHIGVTGQNAARIVEIGAGFGGTAYWLNLLSKRSIKNYTIIDLPLMNVCQGYFLAKAFGAGSVRLFGETQSDSIIFTIIPPHAKKTALAGGFEVLINENSMPEMSVSVVNEYLSWAKNELRGVFYSYNQESFSPVSGIPQTLVPRVVSDVGGFKRLSRNYSWVRRGYVEEVYSVTR